ncbi:hypothetical protein B0J14DRAFT_74998 [Halenospora varia]|nr:hypothetical protein B0J14DRAFT_74998 [Halenospora varia]
MATFMDLSNCPSSQESADSEVHVRLDDIRDGLDECLSNIKGIGTFALFESLDNPPNPGLYLKQGGTIGLPLSGRDAQAIVSASHAAPCGKGEETIVDTRVRKTWELSPSDFELRNPAWKKFVNSIVAKVSEGLGVDATGTAVSAELYKMLLYDEGAMFKPHQDSEKAPRMFATLVIALPSKHEGGEVRVTHAGQTKVFETSLTSDFNASYLAWFADVTHEVKPVLSGRRLVLTYNLIHQSLGSQELSANTDKSMAKLRAILSDWQEGLDESNDELLTPLAFLFEHQYTDTSLCFNGLKGNDRQVATYLRQACDEFKFCLYLANFDRTIEGGCDEDEGWGGGSDFHEIIEECDRSTSLKRVVQLDGTEVAKDMDYSEDLFTRLDPFEDVDPDDEDYSGFTGNEGVSTTHFYHRTVAILLPKCHRVEFFLNPANQEKESKTNYYSGYPEKEEKKETPEIIQWIKRLTPELGRNHPDSKAREELEQICKMVIRLTKKFMTRPAPKYVWMTEHPPFDKDIIVPVLAATVALDNKELFTGLFEFCKGQSSPSMFASAGTAAVRWNLEFLPLKLTEELFTVIKLSERVDRISEFQKAAKIESARSSNTDAAYQDWAKLEIDKTLSSPQIAMETVQDGLALSDLSKQLPSQDIFNKVLPAVKKNVNNTSMAMAFLTSIFDAGKADQIKESVAHTVFKDVISELVDQFSLRSLDIPPPPPKRSFYGAVINRPEPVGPDEQNSRNLVTLYCHCATLNLTAQLSQMTKKLTNEAKAVHATLFDSMYLPFLKLLSTTLQENNIHIQDSPFQPIYKSILNSYILRFVQPEPQPPKDWTRQKVSCGCQDCNSLNAFLINPTQQVGRFALAQKRRSHLQTQLDPIGGFKHDTDRRGSPQTLVVTKTKEKFQASHKDWAGRCRIAKAKLEEFGTERLMELLGEEYEGVVGLHATQPQTVGNAGQLPPLSSGANAANAGRVLSPISRRKVPMPADAEVIELD